jgi:hypothetical protein
MKFSTLKLEGRSVSAAATKLETEFPTRAGALTDEGDRAAIDL